MGRTLIALIGLVVSIQVAAQGHNQQKQLDPVTLTLTTDRQEISIAEYLQLTLTVIAPSDIALSFQFIDESIGPFRVVSRHPLGPLPAGEGMQQWQRAYVLAAENQGELTIPVLAVTLEAHTMGERTDCRLFKKCKKASPRAKALDGKQLSTDPIVINVTTVLPDNANLTKPRDIAPPVALAQPPAATRDHLLWLLVLSLFIVAVAGFWWRGRSRVVPVVEALSRPAHELALADLSALQKFGPDQVSEFYLGLAATVRHYLDQRFDLPAPRRTTAELFQTDNHPIASQRDVIVPLLSACDKVKFARHQPDSQAMQTDWQTAKHFIEQTTSSETA